MPAISFEEFNTLLSIVADENGGDLKTYIRYPYYDIFIYNRAPSTIFDDLRNEPVCADNIPTENDKYHDWARVVRVVNGRTLFGEYRRDESGEVKIYQRKYFPMLMRHLVHKYENKPIGLLSKEGMFNLIAIAKNVDGAELHSLVDLFHLVDMNMSFIYNECGFEDDCVIVTQDMIDAGFTHYYEHYYPEVCHYIRDDFLVTELRVGDAIIVRKQADGTVWHKMFIKEEFELLYGEKEQIEMFLI